MQIRQLARGRQFCLSGSVVNVPNNLQASVFQLPRTLNEIATIAIRLKKRQIYRSVVWTENVRPAAVLKALKWLMDNSSLWRDSGIALNDNWYEEWLSDCETVTHEDDEESTVDHATLPQNSDECLSNNIQFSDMHNGESTCNEDAIAAGTSSGNSSNSFGGQHESIIHQQTAVNIDNSVSSSCTDELPVDNSHGITVEQDMLTSNTLHTSICNDDDTSEQDNIEHCTLDRSVDHCSIHESALDMANEVNCSASSNDNDDNFSEVDENDVPGMSNTLLETLDNSVLTLAPGENQVPLSLFTDTNAEFMAFPSIYCGQQPIQQEDRLVPVHYSDICKWELRSVDRRTAQCIPNIFFKTKKLAIKHVVDKASFAIRRCKTEGRKFTASELLDDHVRDNILRSDEGYKIFSELRNSPAYLQKRKKDVFAMIRQLGLPTWFVSLSAADTNWVPLLKMLSKSINNVCLTDEEVNNLSWAERSALVQSDPVTCSRYFDYRVQQFIRTVLGNKPGALGQMSNYFYRTEWQQRGSPHIHMLVWCDQSPKFMTSTNAEITEFIDSFVTCSASGDEAVVALQTHKHSRTCRKGGKPVCRFGFPVPAMHETTILLPLSEEELLSQSDHKTNFNKIQEALDALAPSDDLSFTALLESLSLTLDQYITAVRSSIHSPKVFLKRNPNECRINPYMLLAGKCWSANHDLQFCLDPYAVASYVVGYLNKDETGMSKLLKDACDEAKNGNKTLQEQVRHIGNRFVNAVEVSAQEACYLILQLPITKGSREVVFIPTSPPSERVFVLKPKEQLQEMHPDSEDVAVSSILQCYSRRPKKLEHMSLADFVANIVVEFPKHLKGADKLSHLNDDEVTVDECQGNIAAQLTNGIVFKYRKTSRVIRSVRYSKTMDPEQYYRERLMLYLPWRNEETDLLAGYSCYQQHYNAQESVILSNGSPYERLHPEAEEALNQACDELPDDIAPTAQQNEAEDCQEGPSSTTMYQFFDPDRPENQCQYDMSNDLGMASLPAAINVLPNRMRQSELLALVRSLNREQFEFFTHVMHKVKTSSDQMNYLLSGGAGVGKSLVVRVLYQALTHFYNKDPGTDPERTSVLLCAPTGKAAYNINGVTLHHAFKVPVNQKLVFKKLTNDALNTLTVKYMNLKMLIIDEISMVGASLFNFIDLRLREVLNNNSLFGGIHVIVIGDLYQLQPVMDQWIFHKDCRGYGALASNLWSDNFTMHELTTIMRQRNDLPFAELLNRLREGRHTSADIDVLQSCQNRELSTSQSTPPHLFPTNKLVDQFNSNLFAQCSNHKITVTAIDDVLGDYTQAVKDYVLNHLPEKATNTGNLHKNLGLAVGLRYDITSNINVKDGLVNGSSCTIRHIEYLSSPLPSIVWVQFDNSTTGYETRRNYIRFFHAAIDSQWTPIFAISMTFQVGRDHKTVTRKQFPLRAATAKTIHKAQGDTLPEVVVHMGSRKQNHMHYVALSRVTSLSGLSITQLNPTKIAVDSSVIEEMQRLRTHASMVLSYIPPYSHETSAFTSTFINARSLHKHFPDIAGDHNLISSNVIGIAESRLQATDNSADYALPGFQLIRADSYSSTGRPYHGLAAYISCDLQIEDISIYTTTDFECLSFLLPSMNCKLAICYKSPQCSFSALQQHSRNALSALPNTSYYAILGDFNISDDDPLYSRFVSHLNSFLPCNQVVSQSTTNYDSMLDHIYTNITSYSHSIFENIWSDHKAVSITFT